MPIDKHIINANLEAEGVINAQLDKSGYTEDETSVMAGKAAIAASITNKGVIASKNDSFHQLSEKVDKIRTSGGIDPSEALPTIDITRDFPNTINTDSFLNILPEVNITDIVVN